MTSRRSSSVFRSRTSIAVLTFILLTCPGLKAGTYVRSRRFQALAWDYPRSRRFQALAWDHVRPCRFHDNPGTSPSHERRQLPQAADHRDPVEFRVRPVRPHARTTQQHGAHADPPGAVDIVGRTVADHHRFAGGDAEQVERRLEDARVWLHEA